MKIALYSGAIIGGLVGGYIPILWGGSLLDITSITLGTIGTIAGVGAGYKFGKYFNL